MSTGKDYWAIGNDLPSCNDLLAMIGNDYTTGDDLLAMTGNDSLLQ